MSWAAVPNLRAVRNRARGHAQTVTGEGVVLFVASACVFKRVEHCPAWMPFSGEAWFEHASGVGSHPDRDRFGEERKALCKSPLRCNQGHARDCLQWWARSSELLHLCNGIRCRRELQVEHGVDVASKLLVGNERVRGSTECIRQTEGSVQEANFTVSLPQAGNDGFNARHFLRLVLGRVQATANIGNGSEHPLEFLVCLQSLCGKLSQSVLTTHANNVLLEEAFLCPALPIQHIKVPPVESLRKAI
mmetsp:Transcript_62147/g.115308  ORF Transcript_62147/g.115308 Transcript_62147/m.115308 type:complete len:247 (-) Transcript_62147:715-1455(-)